MSDKVTIRRLKEASYHKPKHFFKLKGHDGEEALADRDAVVAVLKPFLEETKSTHANWVNYRVTADVGVVVDGDSVEVTDPSADAGPGPKSAAAYSPTKPSGAYTLADLEDIARWASRIASDFDAKRDRAWSTVFGSLFIQATRSGLKAGTPIPGDEPPLDDHGDPWAD